MKYSTLFAMSLALAACQQNKENLANLDLGSLAIPPQTMQVLIKNYKPQTGNAFQNIFVSNFSLKAGKNQIQWSTARDGMPDALKVSTAATYGFSLNSPESVVANFADLVLYNAGINLSQYSSMYCAPSQSGSTSNDMIIYNDARLTGSPLTSLGLRDCEKTYIGLSPNTFDYNKNGIPDYLEMRCGLNPLNANQAFLSTAGDGVSNLDKCKMNIPIDESSTTRANQLFAYKYEQQVNQDGSKNFSVTNIPILNDGQDNFLVFYVTETKLTTNVTSLYTAYAVLTSGYSNKTLQFNYWATAPAKFFNQQVVLP